MNQFNWFKWISEIQALAQSGLTYSQNIFDKERYVRLTEIVSELAAYASNHSIEEVASIFSLEKGYATPKLDVRAFILRENKVLLVQESSDKLWTLPGGWIDVNESPSEAIVRETKEETGFDVAATKLLALWDKLKHDHPPQWPHIYKCFFHCNIIAGQPKDNHEILNQDFFEVTHLPPLSTHRVTEKQILRLFDLVNNPQETQFD